MEFIELREKFYQFESENKLFDLVDHNGVHYWDIFRQEVFETMLYSVRTPFVKDNRIGGGNKLKLIYNEIKGLYVFLKSALYSKKYFVFLASRNVIENTLCDIQMKPLLKVLPIKDTFMLESMLPKETHQYLAYDYIFDSRILRCVSSKRATFRFDELALLCNTYFDVDFFSEKFFLRRYKNFVKDKAYYSFLFRWLKVKKIFLSQNAIQKALFSAANERGIIVYEMQHGVIYDGHMAYSYPRNIEDLNKKTYYPHFLLTLSDFWKKDINLPYTRLITVGNDYYLPHLSKCNKTNNILVASSSAHGVFLSDFLLGYFKSQYWTSSYHFIFKLHPNEYNRKSYYEEKLGGLQNVYVTTNEKSVDQWMEECESIFLIESTSAFEALQSGRKVIVYKKNSWQTMLLLNNTSNVFFIGSYEEFCNALNEETIKQNVTFFQPSDYSVLNSFVN